MNGYTAFFVIWFQFSTEFCASFVRKTSPVEKHLTVQDVTWLSPRSKIRTILQSCLLVSHGWHDTDGCVTTTPGYAFERVCV